MDCGLVAFILGSFCQFYAWDSIFNQSEYSLFLHMDYLWKRAEYIAKFQDSATQDLVHEH